MARKPYPAIHGGRRFGSGPAWGVGDSPASMPPRFLPGVHAGGRSRSVGAGGRPAVRRSFLASSRAASVSIAHIVVGRASLPIFTARFAAILGRAPPA